MVKTAATEHAATSFPMYRKRFMTASMTSPAAGNKQRVADPDLFIQTVFNAAMTGRREARMAGKRLPKTPTNTEKIKPCMMSRGVIRK